MISACSKHATINRLERTARGAWNTRGQNACTKGVAGGRAGPAESKSSRERLRRL